jgi:PAS domain S-box-containing protein
MPDEAKTKAQLLAEARELRARTTMLEARETELRQSQDLWTKVFFASPIPILITRLADDRIMQANGKFFEVFGYRSGEAIGRTTVEIGLWLSVEDRQRMRQRLSEDGYIREMETQLKTGSGAVCEVLASAELIDLDGEQCTLTTLQDVTQRVQAERALRESEARYRSIVDSNMIGIGYWKADGSITFANDLLIEMFGYARQDMLSGALSWQDLTPPEYAPLDQRALAELASRGVITPFEKEYFRKDGSRFPALIGGGCFAGYTDRGAFFVLDITERKRIEQALQESEAAYQALAGDNALLYEQAQQALRTRDEFISVAAHELRTPITTIVGRLELLERRGARAGGMSERDVATLRLLREQAMRLNRLVGEMLDISRLQIGQLTLERTELDLGALAHRLVDELQQVSERHSFVVDTSGEPLMAQGDELRLEQALQNLLNNAVKYSPHGGAIHVRVFRRDQQVCASVADQGIGIPPAALDQLFTRFFRAGNVDSTVTGMGVGLYVVKEIVTLHGGTVTVDSTEGVGSTFTVCLPSSGKDV